MWELIVKTMEDMRKRTRYNVYHHPDDAMPALDFNLSATLRFVPHVGVPRGQVWIVPEYPSGSIVKTEE